MIASPKALYEALQRRGGIPPDRMVRHCLRQTLESLCETHKFGLQVHKQLTAQIRFYQIILEELPLFSNDREERQ